MGSERSAEAEALLQEVEEAVGTQSVRLMPMLLRLSRIAAVGSRGWATAFRLLAEGLIEDEPWRGSLLARRVVAVNDTDHRCWALLGLGQSLLGNYHFAVTAYQRALELAPTNPWYAHNLGHLYDVVMDQPQRAVVLLEQASRALPRHGEVVASYAHALVRFGDVCRARQVMLPVARHTNLPHHHALYEAIIERQERDVTAHLAELGDRRPTRRRRLKRRRTRVQRAPSMRRSTT